jgi:glutathione transport system permease protein
MLSLIFKRVLQAVPVLFGVSVAVFLMIHMIPGDPARLVAGLDATTEDIENVRRTLGLDRPLPVQYIEFVKHAFLGEFGNSFRTGRPVIEEIGSRYMNTLALGATALGFAIVFGVVTGTISAVKRFSLIDNAALLVSILGVSAPTFFLGLLLMLVFSVWLGWFPLSGKDSWTHYVLPAITLGTASAAVISRIMRSSLLDVLDQDYIRTARAKGLSNAIVVGKHALRNAMVPVVTVIGLQLGYLLGGAVVTETVFAWPGLGRLLVQSIIARDFPVVQAAVLLLALTFVIVNLMTDLVYGLLDPRISA